MLAANIRTQLETYLQKLEQPIELVASLDDGAKSAELRELLREIASLSPKIALREDGADARKPSFTVGAAGQAARVAFAGIPMGHEFTSLVLALLQAGGYPPKVEAAIIEQIRNLQGEFRFETFISLSCHNCPDVVQALNLMAVLNPGVTSTMIDGALFQGEVESRKIMAVPTVFVNGEAFGQGRMTLEEILAKVDTGAAAREAEKIGAKEAFDVLVVGGGPAGAAAAIYAARKGIRTGVVAERFGGQVLDTMGIENLISVPQTDGPKLARALEAHVADYEVDVMNLQRAEALEPAGDDGMARVRLAGGATLKARTVILATGARWREIDLAGVVANVTLLEFDGKLRADAVLQAKLKSLPNVTVIVNAQTTEVTGDGSKMNGLVYKDRVSGEAKKLELEGVFVQIGLLPNTDWLKGTVALSPRGEIEVDARGQTSVPGVFAAGDATTTPYKQIVIAMGEGAKASLSAFDHLIRSSAPVAQPEKLAA